MVKLNSLGLPRSMSVDSSLGQAHRLNGIQGFGISMPTARTGSHPHLTGRNSPPPSTHIPPSLPNRSPPPSLPNRSTPPTPRIKSSSVPNRSSFPQRFIPASHYSFGASRPTDRDTTHSLVGDKFLPFSPSVRRREPIPIAATQVTANEEGSSATEASSTDHHPTFGILKSVHDQIVACLLEMSDAAVKLQLLSRDAFGARTILEHPDMAEIISGHLAAQHKVISNMRGTLLESSRPRLQPVLQVADQKTSSVTTDDGAEMERGREINEEKWTPLGNPVENENLECSQQHVAGVEVPPNAEKEMKKEGKHMSPRDTPFRKPVENEKLECSQENVASVEVPPNAEKEMEKEGKDMSPRDTGGFEKLFSFVVPECSPDAVLKIPIPPDGLEFLAIPLPQMVLPGYRIYLGVSPCGKWEIAKVTCEEDAPEQGCVVDDDF